MPASRAMGISGWRAAPGSARRRRHRRSGHPRSCHPPTTTVSMADHTCAKASVRVDELDPDPLVDAPLRFVARDADAADLARVGHMRPSVGLEVEADDLDRPDLLDPLGKQV